MAYKEEKDCYMLHVKEGADASKARESCSQVKIAANIIASEMILDRDNNIFEMFFSIANNYQGNDVHRLLLKDTMLRKFTSEKEFAKTMKNISGDKCFKVCLALADAQVENWSVARYVDLEKDFKSLFMDDRYCGQSKSILKRLQKGGIISTSMRIGRTLSSSAKMRIGLSPDPTL